MTLWQKIFVHKNCVSSVRGWSNRESTVPGEEFRDTECGPDHCEEWQHFCRTHFCNASFPLQILCICKEANKAGKVNPSKASYFSQGLENKGGGKKVGEHFVLSIFKTLGSTYKLWQQWDIQVPRWKNDSQGSFLILRFLIQVNGWKPDYWTQTLSLCLFKSVAFLGQVLLPVKSNWWF